MTVQDTRTSASHPEDQQKGCLEDRTCGEKQREDGSVVRDA